MSSKNNYIPTLDGWRTVAIMMVMGFHFFAHSESIPEAIRLISNRGAFGVDIFFALSGFLICTRILIGIKKYGKLDLKVFYIRRTFRILPPAYFYLLTLWLLSFFDIIKVKSMEIISAITFWRNYLPLDQAEALSYTNHFWSLAIEEHFYLIFPFIMAFIFGKKRLIALISFAVFIAFWRAIDSRYNVFTFIHPSLEYNYQFTFARLDNLLWGAVLAIIYFDKKMKEKINNLFSPTLGYLLILIIIAIIFLPIPAKRIFLAVSFPLLILSTVANPRSVLSKILESKFFRWVGGLSYSLYLWQHLFLNGSQEGVPSWFVFLQSGFPAIFATFLMALISYHVIEQPFIKMGRKVAN